MGMPRKGSRRVEVDGAAYLWRVRGDGYSKQWIGSSPVVLTLTCQRDEDRPGRVMQAWLATREPPTDTPDYEPMHTATLHPAEVRQIIAHALSKGWDPAKRGASFLLPKHPQQPEPCDYEIVTPHSADARQRMRAGDV